MKKLNILLFKKIKSFKGRLILLIRFLSEFIVIKGNNYLILGYVARHRELELNDKLKWYYSASCKNKIILKKNNVWVKYYFKNDGELMEGEVGLIVVIIQFLTGKILLLNCGPMMLKLETYLPAKFYIINWYENYRSSSWRFAASVGGKNLCKFFLSSEPSILNKKSDSVVILGNGPSANLIFSEKYKNMDVIVCNSSIKSEKLLSMRNVVALTFIDAAFYLGNSDYTKKFYEVLNVSLSNNPGLVLYLDSEHINFVSTKILYESYLNIYPVLINSLFETQSNFKELSVEKSSNSVFTSVMLPLAATFYKNIYLVGFDGKEKGLKNYFWKHQDEFQFTNLLETVKTSDPGFFHERNYDEFNSKNNNEIKKIIKQIQADGVEVFMEHPSNIEFLNSLHELKYANNKTLSLHNSLSSIDGCDVV